MNVLRPSETKGVSRPGSDGRRVWTLEKASCVQALGRASAEPDMRSPCGTCTAYERHEWCDTHPVREPIRIGPPVSFNHGTAMRVLSTAVLARRVTLASALLVAISACSSNNSLAPYQPQVSNVADNFGLQATGVANVTSTQSYTWANSGTRATINHSTTTSSGTTLLVIKDAAGTTVYSRALSPSLNEPTSPIGVAGNWTLQLTLTNYTGTMNFRAQKL